jgi:hypothetical protein
MTSIKSFFQQRHNFGRHPFAGADKPAKTTESFWGDFKGFFAKQHRFGRSPFAEMPTSWM